MEIPSTTSRVNLQKWRLALTLYLNYLVHGFGIIILAQNMTALSGAWHVPLATVSFVISGIGIGRLVAYLITGSLADLLSRKLFVLLGMGCYLIFALGMVANPSIPVAYGLAILAGIANSALDAGTYTTLVEINGGKGDGTILIKAFVSLGEFILPLLVATLANHGWWFGWSFLVMAALILLNLLNVLTVRFPNRAELKQMAAHAQVAHPTNTHHRLGAALLLLGYGYTSVLASAAELVGRVLVAFVLAEWFGFSAVCLAGSMAWMLADVPLLCIYFQKRRRLKRLAAETESK